ncbi:MAG TPA: cytochrome c [Gemmatimonadales bacterium]|nr:cytochrome c [Gemmatimonadales bacterium]
MTSKVVLLPAIAAFLGGLGGWAVITVEDLPDYLVAGEPVSLTFTVRQHGVRPLEALTPTIEARSGSLRERVAATPGREAGQYTASLAVPQAGSWTVTIHSGFLSSTTTLVPLEAVAASSRSLPELAETERGRRLFVAKGCATCHLHGVVGPDLAGVRVPPDFLKQFLANPAILAAASHQAFPMPNLHLKAGEIDALVAYLTAETPAAPAR